MVIYFVKALKRLGLLKTINFQVKKKHNKTVINIPLINGIGLTNLILKNEWLDELIKVFVTGTSGTFVDVGVNIGQTLIRLKTVLPNQNYIGFEPNSTCVSYTQQLIALNKFRDCIIQNCALSTKVENLILEKTSSTDPRASVVASLRPSFFEVKEPVLSLDYQSLYIDIPISLVKIDVEGAELEVLIGMKEALIKYQPLITCEVLDSYSKDVLEFTQERANQVSEFLSSIDYCIIQLQTRDNNIIAFKELKQITVKQWTIESYDYNDYMFCPMANRSFVVDKLNEICQNSN